MRPEGTPFGGLTKPPAFGGFGKPAPQPPIPLGGLGGGFGGRPAQQPMSPRPPMNQQQNPPMQKPMVDAAAKGLGGIMSNIGANGQPLRNLSWSRRGGRL